MPGVCMYGIASFERDKQGNRTQIEPANQPQMEHESDVNK